MLSVLAKLRFRSTGFSSTAASPRPGDGLGSGWRCLPGLAAWSLWLEVCGFHPCLAELLLTLRDGKTWRPFAQARSHRLISSKVRNASGCSGDITR